MWMIRKDGVHAIRDSRIAFVSHIPHVRFVWMNFGVRFADAEAALEASARKRYIFSWQCVSMSGAIYLPVLLSGGAGAAGGLDVDVDG